MTNLSDHSACARSLPDDKTCPKADCLRAEMWKKPNWFGSWIKPERIEPCEYYIGNRIKVNELFRRKK